MNRQALCLALAALVLNLVCFAPASAATKPEAGSKFAAKVKREIARLGTGPDARIEVKLRDKTRVAGYVSEVSEDHFAVTDAKTGAVTVVPYPQVKQAKGHNLTSNQRIALAVGLAAATLLAVFIIASATSSD
jgi:hypothetical protein